jgi:predicted deacylase
MRPEEFHPEKLARGAVHSLALEFAAGGHALELPLLVVRGRRGGAVLVVSAGVHGDEYEGIRAIVDTVAALDPAAMCGDLVAAPVVNVAAFRHRARRSPLDGADLARVFPGSPEGTPSQVLAWHFDSYVLARADFYLDLHSGGFTWAMPALVGYDASDGRARAAAFAFGAPAVWEHPDTPPGRTVSAAKARGIPCLYAEAHGGGRIDAADLAVFRRGLQNLLRHLGILEGAPEAPAPRWRLFGGGNIDEGIVAARGGFLLPEVDLLETVEAGQRLGTLVDLAGRPLERYFAPRAGVVVLMHACPHVAAGEPVFLVTGAAPAGP